MGVHVSWLTPHDTYAAKIHINVHCTEDLSRALFVSFIKSYNH